MKSFDFFAQLKGISLTNSLFGKLFFLVIIIKYFCLEDLVFRINMRNFFFEYEKLFSSARSLHFPLLKVKFKKFKKRKK